MNRRSARSPEGKTSGAEDLLSVDIIVPVYNEEKVLVKSIDSLLDIGYCKYSIIIIDDGSTDKSHSIMQANYGNHPKVRLIRQENAGKSSALNKAVSVSTSDIVVCVDADTLVRPDAINSLVGYFEDEKVGAVSGYVKVGNRVNLLTDMQYFEYVVNSNLDREVLDQINGIYVVPGALGAFRRTAVNAIGGFKSDVMAEDCELTLRMLSEGFVVRNAPLAISWTEAPATFKGFIKQRVRWNVGLWQGLFKHNKRILKQRNKALSFVAIPYAWLFRVILPFLIPCADYYFLFGYFVLKQRDLLFYYLVFIAAECLTTFVALLLCKEQRIKFIPVIIQQHVFRHLYILTYVAVLIRLFRGNLYHWNKLPRQGNVNVN